MAESRFPYSDPLIYQDQSSSVDRVLSAVGDLLTQERQERIAKVIEGRTYEAFRGRCFKVQVET